MQLVFSSKCLRVHARRLGWLGCFLILLCACIPLNVTASEMQFQFEIGAKLDPQVQLFTGQKQYNPVEDIFYWVANRRNKPLWFQDQSFNLRAFKFDGNTQKWLRIPVEVKVGDPHLTSVHPQSSKEENPGYSISAQDLHAAGKIRLAVVGWEDPSKPEGSKVGAFSEIEIGDGNPSFFGTWISDGELKKAEPLDNTNYVSFGFVGHEVLIQLREGADFGFTQVVLDGPPKGSYCNNVTSASVRQISFTGLDDRLHILKIYPRSSRDCNSGKGFTGIIMITARVSPEAPQLPSSHP